MTIRRLSLAMLLLSGFSLTPSCGGKALDAGHGGDGDGDGDGDGSGAIPGDGDISGDGDGDASGGTLGDGDGVGDGDASGDGDSDGTYCEPGDVTLCDLQTHPPVCTGIGIQMCAETGAEWGPCVCENWANGGTGGSQNMGGAGGAGPEPGDPEASCSDVVACGGDIRGRWEVSSSCLEVTGSFDLTALGIGCFDAAIWGDLQVQGELQLLESGEFRDNTTTSGDFALRLAQACLDVSGTVVTCETVAAPIASRGFSSVKCLDHPDGGCLCAARVNQAGGLGHVRHEAANHGEFNAIDETLTLSSPDAYTYSYCASENSLDLTPRGVRSIGTTGSVALAPTAPLLWSLGTPSGDAGPETF